MEILIIFLLILLNGVFAMSEISMVSSRKARLERAAKKGDRAAKKVLELSQNPSKFLSTVQIGITLIGILTGIYSGEKIEDDLITYLNRFEVLQPYSETLAVTGIVVILTFFSLVLGELVPKRIGLTMPESISKILAYPMYVISIIAAPFIWLLTFTTDLLLKIMNIKKSKESHVTEEEIKAIIQEGTEAGTVQEIEQDIVENVFHLGDRRINSLMTPRPDIIWINLNDSPETIKSRITETVHRSFPVCKGKVDDVAGIVHVGDLAEELHEKKEIIPRADGSFLVDAALPLPEFTRYFDVDIADDPSLSQINTLGGLVFHFAEDIPRTGYSFQWKGLSIEIMDIDGRRIDKVLVKREQ